MPESTLELLFVISIGVTLVALNMVCQFYLDLPPAKRLTVVVGVGTMIVGLADVVRIELLILIMFLVAISLLFILGSHLFVAWVRARLRRTTDQSRTNLDTQDGEGESLPMARRYTLSSLIVGLVIIVTGVALRGVDLNLPKLASEDRPVDSGENEPIESDILGDANEAVPIKSSTLAGKPSYERGIDIGFYVWHDGSRITITFNGEANKPDGGHRVYEFDVRASNGEILALETTTWNTLDIFETKKPTRLHGRGYCKNGADTFSFATNAAELTFDLQISERITGSPSAAEEREYRDTLQTQPVPRLVYLGEEKRNPSTLPFTETVSS